MLNRSQLAVHAFLINLKNRGWEREVSDPARGTQVREAPGAFVLGAGEEVRSPREVLEGRSWRGNPGQEW